MNDNIVKFKKKMTKREEIENLRKLVQKMREDLEVVFHTNNESVINVFINNWLEALDPSAKSPDINWKKYREAFKW